MAYAMTKCGSLDNCVTYEFICDTVNDMNAIENEYRTIGTVAIVLQGEGGSLEVYIAGSNKQWNSMSNIGGGSSSGGSSGTTNAGLSLHICSSSEVQAGKPKISSPDENTIYLVGDVGETNNLYTEFVYVNNKWEKFGGGSVDLSNYATSSDLDDYAPKASPEFTGSISLGRAANTTNAEGSLAVGNNVSAIASNSQAIGKDTTASGTAAHAEGYGTSAAGLYAHAEGHGTRARTYAVHVVGAYNIYENVSPNNGTYVEVVGNGYGNDHRSNARAVDWNGNEYLQGDLYTNCNADSTGGYKVATESYVNTRIPTPPTTDGTYTLQLTVSSGEPTYSWVSTGA